VGDTNNVVYVTRTTGAVAPVARGRYYDPRPAWSPDGQWIIYADTPEDDTLSVALFLVRPDGTGRTQLTPRGTPAWTPAWSPDGQAIAFGCETNGNAHLCVINADGTGARPLASDGLQNRNPAWSPDGQRIAFQHIPLDGLYDPDLYVMNADGSSRTRLLQGNRGSGTGAWILDWWAPAWSPDGSRLTFTAIQYGVAVGIYTQALDGSAPTLLVDEERYYSDAQYQMRDPEWLRDGSRLAVVVTRCGYEFCDGREVWIFPADGSAVLARIGGVHSPAWRP
jgi:Tol biopolymer transport system component